MSHMRVGANPRVTGGKKGRSLGSKKAKEEEDDDSGSDSDESIDTKRSRLLAEREALKQRQLALAKRQVVHVDGLGRLIQTVAFEPSFMGCTEGGIVECVMESVSRCPEEVRAGLWENVTLVGEVRGKRV